ncbi:MAG: sulfite exporter TauE/SafE family protein [Deltaproteobacteria bacterium]|nr:sulfite exporter TauE/SafE family protein [Deltaproteobacteria bacterium]
MIEIFASVLVASLVGSLHCAGMCGSIVGLFAMSGGGVRPHLGYHVSRGASYVLLGVAAGSLGAVLELAGRGVGISRIAAMVAGASIVLLGSIQLLTSLRLLRPARSARSARPASRASSLRSGFGRIMGRVMDKPVSVRASWLGLGSALLPCGWLYAFVLTAAGTGHPLKGALVMFAFWLGTVPSLLGTGVGLAQLGRRLGARVSMVMSVLLVTIGLATMAQRGRHLVLPSSPSDASSSSHCAGHAEDVLQHHHAGEAE